MITLYHYLSRGKYQRVTDEAALKPTAPFNPRIREEEWEEYIGRFQFPIMKRYICACLEECPSNWKDYGLFELLKGELAGGDHLLELRVEDDGNAPILVRDHKFYSPKAYGVKPQVWNKREVQDSKPDSSG
jgi:hypothetical protein